MTPQSQNPKDDLIAWRLERVEDKLDKLDSVCDRLANAITELQVRYGFVAALGAVAGAVITAVITHVVKGVIR